MLVKLTVGIRGELRVFIVIAIKSSYAVCDNDNFPAAVCMILVTNSNPLNMA
jgi:hypothetical protein